MKYGPLWVDLQGTKVLPEEEAILQHNNTGGVILFTKNFESKAQICELVHRIRSVAKKELLIGVDHEGGRIWRFTEGFTKPESAEHYGQMYKENAQLALTELQQAGYTVGGELLECGIDLTFAPVLDINHGLSSVIRDRSYSDDPNVVIACARAFIKGLKSAGMGSVGKHFPGHGGCTMDSHVANAVDTRSYSQIEESDMQPFIELKDELAAIMPAHVVYEEVSSSSAGFSKYWLQDVLREKIGFQGAIISDCLSMQGSNFANDLAKGATIALNAGCDMVITSQQTREYLLEVLNKITWDMSSDQLGRIESLAGDLSVKQA